MEMSLEDMIKDDGLDLLITHLDKVFEKDKNDNAYEKYIIFEDIRRNHGEDIGEFMIRFDRVMNQAKAIEIVYPDNVLAFKLMRSMNLSTDEKNDHDSLHRDQVCNNAVCHQTHFEWQEQCRWVRIKQETHKSLYARAAYSNNNQGYRAGKKSGYSKNPQYSSNGYQQQPQKAIAASQ